MLPATRIEASVEVLVRPPEVTIPALIHRHSQGAALVFLGLPLAAAGEEDAVADRLLRLLVGMPPTLLVRNAGPFRGRLV